MLEWAPNPNPVGTSPAHGFLAHCWNHSHFCFEECFQTHIFVLEKWSAFLMSCSSLFRILVSTNNIFLHYHFSPRTRLARYLWYHLLHLKEEWEEQRETQCCYWPRTFPEKAGSVRRSWATGLVRTAAPAGGPAGDTNQCLCFAALPLKWIGVVDTLRSICTGVYEMVSKVLTEPVGEGGHGRWVGFHLRFVYVVSLC